MPKLAVIIPTMQRRDDFLREAIRSVPAGPDVSLFVISPSAPQNQALKDLHPDLQWITSEASLPEAINQVVFSLKPDFTHFGWIGDDDAYSIFQPTALMLAAEQSAFLAGTCRLLNEKTQRVSLFRQKKFRLTRIGLAFFANPIAQPSTIINIEKFKEIGGINPDLDLAFDHDLFTRLILTYGKPIVVAECLSTYRVHDQTLSESNWERQLAQSAAVRKQVYGSKVMKAAAGLVDFFRLRVSRLIRPKQT